MSHHRNIDFVVFMMLLQDTGKTTFEPRRRVSSIDLNRAGTGLMEIVSEPDLRSLFTLSIKITLYLLLFLDHQKKQVIMFGLYRPFYAPLARATAIWSR